MRKCFVLMAVFALTAAPVRGQGLEFSGGVNISELSGDAIQAARNVGMNFGLDLVIPVGPLGLNLGADWSQKGMERAAAGATSASIVDLSYIELPLHFRFPLIGAGPIRLNMILGPTLGINLGCDITVGGGGVEECASSVEGFDPKKMDWAGAAGLGLSFSLGGLAYAGVDLKYALGFTSISETAAETLKNRTFTRSSHLGFDLF
jgi:hypothetical protein